VGSAIRRKLQEKGYTNLLLSDIDDFDMQRQAEVEAFFERERPGYMFLAAAKVGGIWANKTYPAEFIYSNLSIEVNVIHDAYK
jgi:GDP-L-fucose synthase